MNKRYKNIELIIFSTIEDLVMGVSGQTDL
jgi:hypothetical protein